MRVSLNYPISRVSANIAATERYIGRYVNIGRNRRISFFTPRLRPKARVLQIRVLADFILY